MARWGSRAKWAIWLMVVIGGLALILALGVSLGGWVGVALTALILLPYAALFFVGMLAQVVMRKRVVPGWIAWSAGFILAAYVPLSRVRAPLDLIGAVVGIALGTVIYGGLLSAGVHTVREFRSGLRGDPDPVPRSGEA